MQDQITPLILTFNEAPNIGRTLERLDWAKEIVVLDSYSTDETLEIVKAFPRTRVVERKFDTHSAQWNYGLDQCTTEWVLALDADYVLDEDFIGELRGFQPQSGIMAYVGRFRYCVQGRPLRATLYPPRVLLFSKRRCRYEQDGHTQALRVDGNTGWLRGHVNHDDRKPLSRWLWAQDRYALLEVAKLTSTPPGRLSLQDRIRYSAVLAPPIIFFYTMFCKGLILDGWPGWYYVFQRTLAEMILSLRLVEARLAKYPIP